MGTCQDCGAGMRVEGGQLIIQAHAMGCATLRLIAERSKTHCTSCDSELIVERDGDLVYCPKGCTHRVRGEAALEVLDAAGSGWIREELAKNSGAQE